MAGIHSEFDRGAINPLLQHFDAYVKRLVCTEENAVIFYRNGSQTLAILPPDSLVDVGIVNIQTASQIVANPS